MSDKLIQPEAMTRTQLARLYGIDIATLDKWIELIADKIGPVPGRIYTPQQVRIMFEHWDPPPSYKFT